MTAAEEELFETRVHAISVNASALREDDLVLFPTDEITDELPSTNVVFNEYVLHRASVPRRAIFFIKTKLEEEWVIQYKEKKNAELEAWFSANKDAVLKIVNENITYDEEGTIYGKLDVNEYNENCSFEAKAPFSTTVMEDIMEGMTITLEGRRYIRFPATLYTQIRAELPESSDEKVLVIAVEGQSYGEYFAAQESQRPPTAMIHITDPKFYFGITLSLKYDSLKLVYNTKRDSFALAAAGNPQLRSHYLKEKNMFFARAPEIRTALLEFSERYPSAVFVNIEDDEKETYCICAITLELLLKKHCLVDPEYEDYLPTLIKMIGDIAEKDGLVEDGHGIILAQTAEAGAVIYDYLTSQ